MATSNADTAVSSLLPPTTVVASASPAPSAASTTTRVPVVATSVATTLGSVPSVIELGAPTWSAVRGLGGVWVQVDQPVAQLVKIDETTGAIVLRIDHGTSAAEGDGGMWVTVDGQARKIDAQTGEVLLSTMTSGANYIAVGAGGVWVPGVAAVQRLDPETGAVVATVPVENGLTDLAASDEAVWVTNKDAGTVRRIDPVTNTVVAEIKTGAGAHDLLIDERGVWITNYRANTVTLINPTTNTVVTTIEGVGSGVGIASSGEAIYVSRRGNGVFRIDPVSYEVTSIANFGEWNYGIAYVDGVLWLSSGDTGVVRRLNLEPT